MGEVEFVRNGGSHRSVGRGLASDEPKLRSKFEKPIPLLRA